jgi:hypothetical protein
MPLHPTANRLAELDEIIRVNAEERNVLLQLLTKLQALTFAMPMPVSSPHTATAFNYGYGGSTGGYTGINAFLLRK